MTDTDLYTPTPPSPPGRLERPVVGRWVAGVAAALSQRWGIPRWPLRIAFAVLVLVGGLGALLYFLGWLFIPREGDAEAPIALWVEHLREWQAWAGAALVGLAAVIVLSYLDVVATSLIWAAALVVFGTLLYRGDLAGLDSRPGGETTPGPVDHAPVTDVVPASGGFGGDVNPPPVPEAPRRGRPGPQPSFLGRLTLGAMFLTIGIMAAIDLADLTNPTSRHYFAAAIIVVGVGLLVGTLYGRSRGLVFFGVLLAPFVLVASLADMRFDGEFGDVEAVVASAGDLQPRYRLDGGRIYLDLRRLVLEGETVEVDARVGVGQIEVLLPPNYDVEIESEVGLGEVDVLGRSSGGFGRERNDLRPGAGGRLVLGLAAGVGQVQVHDHGEFFVPLPVERDPLVISPSSVEQLEPFYSVGEGSLQLDLRDLSPDDPFFLDPVGVEAVVEIGEIVVILPTWLDVSVAAQVGSGGIEMLGGRMRGSELYDELYVQGNGTHQIELFLRVERGIVTVVRP